MSGIYTHYGHEKVASYFHVSVIHAVKKLAYFNHILGYLSCTRVIYIYISLSEVSGMLLK